MANNLERTIAIVGSNSKIEAQLSQLGARLVILSLNEMAEKKIEKQNLEHVDAILFNEVSEESTASGSFRLNRGHLIEEFHQSSRPIAGVGRSLLWLPDHFKNLSLEISVPSDYVTPQQLHLKASIEKARAIATACANSDYVSDRENKVLTTLGSLAASDGAASVDRGVERDIARGIERLVRELFEMA